MLISHGKDRYIMKHGLATEWPVSTVIFLRKGKDISGLKELPVFGISGIKWTKDSASFNWNDRSRLENARKYTYESSCIKCHENLFPAKLSKTGEDAHLYYKPKQKNT